VIVSLRFLEDGVSEAVSSAVSVAPTRIGGSNGQRLILSYRGRRLRRPNAIDQGLHQIRIVPGNVVVSAE
jgi:hypothetical protein